MPASGRELRQLSDGATPYPPRAPRRFAAARSKGLQFRLDRRCRNSSNVTGMSDPHAAKGIGSTDTRSGRRWGRLAASALIGSLALACSSSGSGGAGPDAGGDATSSQRCIPGEQVSCACPGTSVPGAQTCNATGTGYGPCVGCPMDDAAASVDAGGDVTGPGADASSDSSTVEGDSGARPDAADGAEAGEAGPTCAGDGVSCFGSGAAVCCSGICLGGALCGYAQGQACIASGNSCSHNYDCCSGTCSGGSCVGCTPAQSFCTGSECCAGTSCKSDGQFSLCQ
jgi:hypothetical protein